MNKEEVERQLNDLIWALDYAQPYVDCTHDRPKTIDELNRGNWTDDYKRFWIITQQTMEI